MSTPRDVVVLLNAVDRIASEVELTDPDVRHEALELAESVLGRLRSSSPASVSAADLESLWAMRARRADHRWPRLPGERS